MIMTESFKGVLVGETYIILNGVEGISEMSFYDEIVKNELGKKIKIKHQFFVINYLGGESIRFERKGGEHIKPKRDINNPHTLEIYVDEPLLSLRNRLISELIKK